MNKLAFLVCATALCCLILSFKPALASEISKDQYQKIEQSLLQQDWAQTIMLYQAIEEQADEKEVFTQLGQLSSLSKEAKFWSLFHLSELLYKDENPNKALQSLQQIDDQMHDFGSVALAKTNLLYSDIYEELSQFDSSAVYLDKILMSNLGDYLKQSKGDLLNRKGNLENRLYNYDSAIKYYQLVTEEMPVDSTLLANVYHGYAYAYRKKGELDSAAIFEYKSLRLSQSINYKHGELLAYQALSILSFYQKEYQACIEKAKTLVDLLEKTSKKAMLANTYNLIGVAYSHSSRPDSGLYFHKRSLAIKEDIGNLALINSSLNNIAVSFIVKQMPDSAISYLLRAKPIMEEMKDTVNLANLYANIGSVHMKFYAPKEARVFYKKAYHLAKSKEANYEMIVGLEGLMASDTMENKFKSAFLHQSEILKVNEAFLGVKKQNEIAKLREEYQAEKKEKDLQLSQALLSQEEQKSKQRGWLLFGAIVISVIALLVTLVFWKLYLLNKKLRLRNELLLKEQNHRIKNNLQMISNLLTLQSSSIESEEGKAALDEGKTRIHSISILHKMLYQGTSDGHVNVYNYLHELCHEMEMSVNRSFELNISIPEELVLPVEKVVSLGLLVSELLMNSVKHVSYEDDLLIEIDVTTSPRVTLKYNDNGQGTTTDVWNNSQSFGNRMIKIQSQQLHGEYEVSSDNGFGFELSMS